MFSIVATLKQRGLNPRHWLSWYLKSCAAASGRVPQDVAQFLPWNLTAERCAELTSPEASVPINDSSCPNRPPSTRHNSPRSSLMPAKRTDWANVYRNVLITSTLVDTCGSAEYSSSVPLLGTLCVIPVSKPKETATDRIERPWSLHLSTICLSFWPWD